MDIRKKYGGLPERTRMWRRVRWYILAAFIAYIVSPLVVLRVPVGSRSFNTPSQRTSLPIPVFAVSSGTLLNRAVRVMYYPMIQCGEAIGLIKYIDDARGEMGPNVRLGMALIAPML